MFPLCQTCAETEQQEASIHTEEVRAILGIWCTVELNEAIVKGYVVAKIYGICDFEETSDKLIAEYIQLYLHEKPEPFGYPSWCMNEEKF